MTNYEIGNALTCISCFGFPVVVMITALIVFVKYLDNR